VRGLSQCPEDLRRPGDSEGIDLTVNAGEVVVIMVQWFRQKQLLRMINHLEPMDWGKSRHGKLVGYEPLPGGGVRPVRKRLAQSRAAARVGMCSTLQFVRALTALENIVEAPVTVIASDRRRRARSPRVCSMPWAWPGTRIICRIACPVASSSVSRSRVPWRGAQCDAVR